MKTSLAPKLALPGPASSRPRSSPEPTANAPRPLRAQGLSLVDRPSGGGAAEKVKSLFKLPDVGGWWDRHVERPFVMGRDGFVAVDERGQVVGGGPPAVRVRAPDF